MAESMMNSEKSKEQAAILEDLERAYDLSDGMMYQSSMLLNLINDLLDFAKFENNRFSFVETFFDLNNLIKRAFDTIQN